MKNILLAAVVTFVCLSGCKKEPQSKCAPSLCKNGSTCNETTGNCNCPHGFEGIDCSIVTPSCQLLHNGTLIFVNTHDDPYYIDINGVYAYYISAHSSKTITEYPSKCFSTHETQASGYIFYPTEYNGNHCVTDCQTTTVSF